jgi:hypothetical protein
VRYSRDKIMLGGHSKGGNLAAYSAIHAPINVQSRVSACFSHDGPGFKDALNTHLGFLRVQQRLHKTIPQSALVGMLLEHQENAKIIKSRTVSLLQHDPFTWVVDNGAFLPLEQLTMDARHVDRTLSTWLLKKNPDERERIVDALFGILETTDIQSFHQLRTDWQKMLPAVARQVRHLDADTRELLFRTLGELALISVKALPETIKKES